MEYIDRLVTIMDTISEKAAGGIGITEIAKITQLSKGTLHRILTDMKKHGLISQDPGTKKYRLGAKSLVWGSRFIRGQDPLAVLTDYCDKLADRTNLYTYLCCFESGEVYCIYARQPVDDRNRYFVHVGQRMPLHCTAAAKAILAFQPMSIVDALMSKNVPRKYTEYTITDRENQTRQLDEISRTHLAFCNEELEIGVSAVSTPIFQENGEVIFSISVIGGSLYINSNRELLIRELLKIGEGASKRVQVANYFTAKRP